MLATMKINFMKILIPICLSFMLFGSSCSTAEDEKLLEVEEIVKAGDYDQYEKAVELFNEILVENPYNTEAIDLLIALNKSRQIEYERICSLYISQNNLEKDEQVVFPWLTSRDLWNEWIWWYPEKEIVSLKDKLKKELISEKVYKEQEKILIENAQEVYLKEKTKGKRIQVNWDLFNQHRKELLSRR